ncbi:hypothetical protein DICPUDRAFT_33259 [Dictyostelium purpureum]|uniref:Cytochrome b5 heme-binding domain-containing protein n=1 Tax=Dictyostelium purpureum TaxID=5786 RepID=F0ZKI6_DICPU|nr:uncharacterized protein DICPUDRAFT_33259 [Dictyostelium purpureum]EGC35561.1 hypothetical protein DICPUDRAFT_33259 [Dictyostelium purpureum]|eukprot:XP_003287932.1 hypothetical protein DICPUDRAFT_33259 [Dictyostelium purpureum]
MLKKYSWVEISKHNNESDCWVVVNGIVYDVTKWLPCHPGGKDAILLSAGNDITNLFESYHPFTNTPNSYLKQYEIGEISVYEHPKFVEKSKFYSVLKERVRKHFKDTNQDPKISIGILSRLALVYLLIFVFYYFAHLYSTNFFFNCIMSFCFSISMSLLSLHMMHDSCHFALTHSPILWKLFGATYDLFVGASFFYWSNQHVVGHHVYTNIRNADPDIGDSEVEFRIVTPYQHRYSIYRFQHIYAPLLYGLYSIKYRLCDYTAFIDGYIGRIRCKRPTSFDIGAFIIGKIFFLYTRFYLPLQIHSFSNYIVYFFIAEYFFGAYLSFGFQVSHSADELKISATPRLPEEQVEIGEDWAIHQLKTTLDYGADSLLCHFFSGGVNLQVIHHLFPSLNQEYYPQIVPIVEQLCKEFNLKYNYKDTFTEALVSHIKFLYKMGNDPNYIRKPYTKND